MSDVARAKDFAIRARGQMREANNRVAISLLAQAFHALEHADGLHPWHPKRFYRWAIEHFHTDAERDCARFVLSVWNRGDLDELDAENGNKLGRFDTLDGVARWDRFHRVAFATDAGRQHRPSIWAPAVSDSRFSGLSAAPRPPTHPWQRRRQ